MKIPINQIFIGERQRIDLGHPLDDLASIGDPEVGLIQPITVEEISFPLKDGPTYRLLAGRRRLEWHIRSDKTEIEANIKGQLSEIQRQKIEWFEDNERKDRTWQEECIGFSKLYNLIRLEKMAQSQSWTTRAMAKFTGMQKTTLSYSLEIASMLKAEPRDDEMWNAKNFTEAIKLVVDRNYKSANDELETRRAVWQQREQAARQVTEPGSPTASFEDLFAEEAPSTDFVQAYEPAQILADTPPKTKVFIHGQNIAFEDAVPGINFMTGTASIILMWKPNESVWTNAIKAIRPQGLGVAWYETENFGMFAQENFLSMNWPLIWNRINSAGQTDWPFSRNYSEGWVFCTEMPEDLAGSFGSVISCPPEGYELPYAVVDWCLKALDENNLAVLCPCNAPVHAVAMTGRIPIWYEADPIKFQEKVQQLKNYYLDTIPNAEIYLRKVDSTGEWTSELLP